MFSSSSARATTPSAPWAGVAEPRPATAFLTTGTKAGSGLVCALPPRLLTAALKASACWACWPMVTWANLVTTGLADEPPM